MVYWVEKGDDAMRSPVEEKDYTEQEDFFEDMDEQEAFDEELYDDYEPRRKKHRAEVILGIIALLCVMLLVGVVTVSLPFFRPAQEDTDPDPEALMHNSRLEEEVELKETPIEETEPEETTEPTIPPELNPYNKFDFQYSPHNYLICTAQKSFSGVDVSAFQKNIDWKQVAASGIQFAMIRLGFRGYGAAGKLVEDEYAKKNLKGASEAGLAVGAYFFSQATTLNEVSEEIEFQLKILGDFKLGMPIVLDWEVPVPEARTRDVDRRTLTDMLKYYCDEMNARGYQPMVYFNWGQSSRMLYLNELEDYPFWLALYQDRMTYPYRVEMWQYTCTGQVPGIPTEVDIDVFMPDLRAR